MDGVILKVVFKLPAADCEAVIVEDVTAGSVIKLVSLCREEALITVVVSAE